MAGIRRYTSAKARRYKKEQGEEEQANKPQEKTEQQP